MTVPSTTYRNDYTGTAGTLVFPYTFRILDSADIVVTAQYTTGDPVTVTSGFTVSGVGSQSGGNITFTSAPFDDATLVSLTFTRNPADTQTFDIRNQTAIPRASLEDALDRRTMVSLKQQEEIDRSLKIPVSDVGVSVTLPPASQRALKTLAFDASGNAVVGEAPTGGIVSVAMTPVVQASTLANGRADMGPWADISVNNSINVLDRDYGAVGDGVTDDRAAIQAAIDAAPDGSVVVIPGGKTYKLTVSNVGPNDWWTEDGEAVLDTAFNTALAIRDRRNLTIVAEGATFDCDDEYTVTFYKSANCKWIGGKFVGDTSYKVGTKEASAILIERCSNVWAIGCQVDKFYRNIFIYHCAWSGAESCLSTDAGYFCYYASGQLGVSLSGVPPINGKPRSSDTRFVKCVAYSGKYGNFLLANAEWKDCSSFDAGRQGVPSYHVRTDNAGFNVVGGIIYESSNQNSGDVVDGIAVAAEGIYVGAGTDNVDGVFIGGGLRISGCRYGIQATACSNVTVDDVHIKDFYLGGICALTRNISSADYDLVNISIGKVNIGPFNSSSTLSAATYASKGALIIETNDSVPVKNALVSGAVLDGNNGGAIAPTSTWYELKCNDPNVVIGDILVRGTGTQQRTATTKAGYEDRDISTTGTQSITGVGFKPKVVRAFVTLTSTGAQGTSQGISTGPGNDRTVALDPTTHNWVSSGQFLLYYVDSSNYAYAVMTSLDSDGFTITWSKSGTPTGTVRITYVCER